MSDLRRQPKPTQQCWRQKEQSQPEFDINRHAPSLACATTTLIDTQQRSQLALMHLSCSDELVIMVMVITMVTIIMVIIMVKIVVIMMVIILIMIIVITTASILANVKDVEGESYLFSVGGSTADMCSVEIIHRTLAYPQMSTGQGHSQAALHHAHQQGTHALMWHKGWLSQCMCFQV